MRTLERHLIGIIEHWHRVPFGVVEAINGNIRSAIRRGRGYNDHEYLPSGRVDTGPTSHSGTEPEKHYRRQATSTRRLRHRPLAGGTGVGRERSIPRENNQTDNSRKPAPLANSEDEK